MSSAAINTPSTTPVITPSPSYPSSAEMAATAALFTSPNTSATFDTSNLHDPLKINLLKQIRSLLGVISAAEHHHHFRGALEVRYAGIIHLLKQFLDSSSCVVAGAVVVDKGRVLDALSRLLSVRELVGDVVRLFRPIVIDLFARWLVMVDGDVAAVEGGEELIEERLEALASLVEVYEELFP